MLIPSTIVIVISLYLLIKMIILNPFKDDNDLQNWHKENMDGN